MISFVETKLFTRLVQEYLSDDEYSRLQQALAAAPEVGSVIPGSGGVRKMRWGVAGRGKRGGLRVIYYLRNGKIRGAMMCNVWDKVETARELIRKGERMTPEKLRGLIR